MPGFTTKPEQWSATHTPAANTQATIAKAAVTNGTHYVTSITVSACGAANEDSVIFNLRDSTTGAGNVLWAVNVGHLANSGESVSVSDINVAGVEGQAITLESSAAPAATNFASVAVTGYTVYRA